jgi:hypothetical protein
MYDTPDETHTGLSHDLVLPPVLRPTDLPTD